MDPGPERRSGPWDDARVRKFLADTVIPVRIASQGAYPVVQSLWFVPVGLTLWCATQADSVLARRLEADDRCGFEVAPDSRPYRGVRGTGHGTLVRDGAGQVLERLIDRYLTRNDSDLAQWLLSRVETEVAIKVTPRTLASWDYSGRM